jgi:small subunit ribosomal protein S2
MNHAVSIEQLLAAGAHFGHLTRRWNPKMEQFIFTERNGIHIIDLRKTQILIDIARKAINDIASKGKIVLFVGTKNQARKTVEGHAKSCSQHYVTERWLGGMLTNFATIRKSIKRLEGIDKMEVDGTFEKITKKERLLLVRERDRLRTVFGGIEDMTRLPGALLVIDIKKEHIAVNEAKILGIPVIALVDTNCDPEEVDYPIPCNDDSVKAIDIIAKIMADAVNEGSEIAKVREAELEATEEKTAKEFEIKDEEEPKVKRKMRGRKASQSDARKGQKRQRPGKEDRPTREKQEKPSPESLDNSKEEDQAEENISEEIKGKEKIRKEEEKNIETQAKEEENRDKE